MPECFSRFVVLIAFCLSFGGFSYAVEEKEKTNTIVTIIAMCGGCAEKIAKRFEDKKDVAKVECSIEKEAIAIVPKDGVQLSGKEIAIWEILEAISKTPIKLVSPERTFTSQSK
jgi:periplasmic mercuric ion binding protein